jgi:hypothetical protein
MMIRSTRNLLILASVALPLSACSSAKEEFGLTRRSPDEFAIVQRAPLEMPPDYYLRPPTPGADRPQEQAPSVAAQQALLGTTAAKSGGTDSAAEKSILQKSGATSADPNIRATIDGESGEMAISDQPTVKRILNIGGDTKKSDLPASVVDPTAESARIKANKESGKPVTDGVTPSIKK